MDTETILCIESKLLRKVIKSKGFIPVSKLEPEQFLNQNNVWFAPRAFLEHCTKFRQIIPYIILRHEDSVVIYKRTSRGNEKRLHKCLSIGFGGHVDLQDSVFKKSGVDVIATLRKASYREVNEEIIYDKIKSKHFIGYLYENITEVDKAHFGIVEVWKLSKPYVAGIDKSLEECRFIKIEELWRHRNKMERWSFLCSLFLKEQRDLNQWTITKNIND